MPRPDSIMDFARFPKLMQRSTPSRLSRSSRPSLPVVILTAKGSEAQRVEGLRDGADDYVVKPFSVRELLARVEAVLRRTPERPSNVAEVRVPGGHIDPTSGDVIFDDGRRLALSEREAELLRFLASNPNRCHSRDEILLRVWQLDH